MFDLSEWVMENLISGYQNRTFAPEYVAVLTANYVLKGVLSNEQAEQIANATAVPIISDIPAELPEEPAESEE